MGTVPAPVAQLSRSREGCPTYRTFRSVVLCMFGDFQPPVEIFKLRHCPPHLGPSPLSTPFRQARRRRERRVWDDGDAHKRTKRLGLSPTSSHIPITTIILSRQKVRHLRPCTHSLSLSLSCRKT
ncbi:hypothetical protein Hanom_Chr16g01510031 [Helianthus anomalus]